MVISDAMNLYEKDYRDFIRWKINDILVLFFFVRVACRECLAIARGEAAVDKPVITSRVVT